jgi:hypothetical protein
VQSWYLSVQFSIAQLGRAHNINALIVEPVDGITQNGNLCSWIH